MAGRVGAPGSGTEGGEAGGCVDAALTLAPPALPKVALTTHSRLRGPTESIWTGRYRRYRMWQRWIRARTRLMRIRYQSLPAGRAAGPRAIFDPEAARSPRALSASAAEVQRRRRRSLVLELVGTVEVQLAITSYPHSPVQRYQETYRLNFTYISRFLALRLLSYRLLV